MASYRQVVEDQAFVTLATNDTYALGALVLGHSLRRVGTTRKLVCMITEGVTQGIREQLTTVFNNVVIVNVFDSNDTANLALLTRPDLGVTFTKLHCWRLTQFTKCVFLDADTLVLHNVDELFEREELSAAPDVGWPDCFNSGVFVFRPSEETYNALVQMAVTSGSFDGGDQGLLNMYFSDWATKDIARHLPFIYNVVSTTFYSYAPAFQYYGRGTKIVHFIGAQKPWHHVYNTATRRVEGSQSGQCLDFLQLWWEIFMSEVQPCLDPTLSYEGLQTYVMQLISKLQGSKLDTLPSHCTSVYCCNPTDYEHYCPSKPARMVSPYVPPDIKTYYQPIVSPRTTQVTFIENKDNRTFSFHEAFFSEPPMTSDENYPSPERAYDYPQFEQHWTEFANPPPEAPQPETDSNDATETSPLVNSPETQSAAHPACATNEGCTTSSAAGEGCEQTACGARNWSDAPEGAVGAVDDTHCHSETNESGGSRSDSMGLVGELASLRIDKGDHYSEEELHDRERQYQWERGQIDYLGKDSFSLIQQRIDRVIEHPEEGSAQPAAAAAPRQAAPAPAAPVAAAPKKGILAKPKPAK